MSTVRLPCGNARQHQRKQGLEWHPSGTSRLTRYSVLRSKSIHYTWSPLTESNRRPSPYHESPNGSIVAGRAGDQAEHEHRPAQAPDRPSQARFAPQSAPQFDLATLGVDRRVLPSVSHEPSHFPAESQQAVQLCRVAITYSFLLTALRIPEMRIFVLEVDGLPKMQECVVHRLYLRKQSKTACPFLKVGSP
jgi:hypothetical protein